MWKSWSGSPASGFQRLAANLRDVGVTIESPSDIGERVAQLTRKGELVLVALRGTPAHCVVVEAANSSVITLHDPASGTEKSEGAATFFARAAGDIATIS